jgi:hypothetical protein
VSFVDWFQMIAVERGVPDGWSWFQSEVRGERPNHVFIVRGACIAGTYTRGKNKGKPKRDAATQQELVITSAEMDARKQRWEQETGKCSHCLGEGKVVSGVSVRDAITTHSYRSCKPCKGNGAAP